MKITLKNFKYSEFASHETHCFEASVYIDGKRAGIASGDGNGGCMTIHPHALRDKIDAYARTLPPVTYDEITVEQDAETILGVLITQTLIERDLNRYLRTGVVWLTNQREIKFRKMPANLLSGELKKPDLSTRLKDCAAILNVLPHADALRLFKMHA